LESTFNAEYDLAAMNLPDLVTKALKASVTERARLAETLLESLDALSEEEHRHLWTEEAARRDAELDSDPPVVAPRRRSFAMRGLASGSAAGHLS
jgi:hypothetical protein